MPQVTVVAPRCLSRHRLVRGSILVVVAVIGLALALGGAVLISLASQPEPEPEEIPGGSAALA